jgi:hypothetical protein
LADLQAALAASAQPLPTDNLAPVPVPVSERLPGPEDCNALGSSDA